MSEEEENYRASILNYWTPERIKNAKPKSSTERARNNDQPEINVSSKTNDDKQEQRESDNSGTRRNETTETDTQQAGRSCMYRICINNNVYNTNHT